MSSLFFGPAPNDPAAHVTSVVLLVGVSLAVAFVPALRAARVSPAEAMRRSGATLALTPCRALENSGLAMRQRRFYYRASIIERR